jgi:hypothetical protein
MHEVLVVLMRALVIGAGATAFLDLITLARQRMFGAPAANYALVGRWLGHMSRGTYRHEAIGAATPMPHESLIGWTLHYVVGIAFAAVLLAIWGMQWACRPTLGPALIIGIGSVIFPFFIMQPGMGAGIAASRTPSPNRARLRSLTTHALFGLGLYVTAIAAPTGLLVCSA